MFDYKDISKEHLSAQVSRIIEVVKSIELGKVTILTGGNALGKSVIRKQLVFHIDNKLTEQNIEHDKNHTVASVSMQLRTESRPEWSALSNIAADTPWSSTSAHTLRMLVNLLKNTEEDSSDKRFLVIDELEIGMSREVQVGTCQHLNSKMEELLKNTHGILIITHSEDVVKTLKHDNWINLEGMSEDEWLNREIVPVNPEDLAKWSTELFCAIRDKEIEIKNKK